MIIMYANVAPRIISFFNVVHISTTDFGFAPRGDGQSNSTVVRKANHIKAFLSGKFEW